MQMGMYFTWMLVHSSICQGNPATRAQAFCAYKYAIQNIGGVQFSYLFGSITNMGRWNCAEPLETAIHSPMGKQHRFYSTSNPTRTPSQPLPTNATSSQYEGKLPWTKMVQDGQDNHIGPDPLVLKQIRILARPVRTQTAPFAQFCLL